MKKQTYWFPKNRAQQLIMFTNIKQKISGYVSILPLSNAKAARIAQICDIFIAVFNFVEQTRATSQNVSEWADGIFTGAPVGAGAPDAPVFQTFTMPQAASIGIFEEFRKLVDEIKSADNYTRGIGEDLMIVAPESADLVMADIVAAMKVAPLAGTYKVRIEGSLQGMSAMRVEYQKKGAGNWQTVGFLTKLPGEITVTPTVAGEPESGELRCVLIEANEPVGQFSPNYPVTVG